MLTLDVLLGLTQIVAATHAASLQRGYRWTSSPRDGPAPALRGVARRLDRALRNFLETFPLFVAVVLAAHVLGSHNALTEWGHGCTYGPASSRYRSFVWNAATAGMVLSVVALFLG